MKGGRRTLRSAPEQVRLLAICSQVELSRISFLTAAHMDGDGSRCRGTIYIF